MLVPANAQLLMAHSDADAINFFSATPPATSVLGVTKGRSMNIDEFWAVIQQVHDHAKGHMDGKCEMLKAELRKLTPADAAAFSDLFDSLSDRAYSWPLWGAAYVIHGGCSDDTFSDFRASLISRGKGAFEKAMADPDSLAAEEIDEEAFFYEGFEYAVSEGVESVLGKRPLRKAAHPKEPSGQEWDEDSVGENYPRLSDKFG